MKKKMTLLWLPDATMFNIKINKPIDFLTCE